MLTSKLRNASRHCVAMISVVLAITTVPLVRGIPVWMEAAQFQLANTSPVIIKMDPNSNSSDAG